MDDLEFERLAAVTRKRILDIWGGDAKRADEFACILMRYYKDRYRSYGITDKGKDHMMKRLAALIQR